MVITCMSCIPMSNHVNFSPLQTSLQVVFTCAQSNLWPGNIGLHGGLYDNAWRKSDVRNQA